MIAQHCNINTQISSINRIASKYYYNERSVFLIRHATARVESVQITTYSWNNYLARKLCAPTSCRVSSFGREYSFVPEYSNIRQNLEVSSLMAFNLAVAKVTRPRKQYTIYWYGRAIDKNCRQILLRKRLDAFSQVAFPFKTCPQIMATHMCASPRICLLLFSTWPTWQAWILVVEFYAVLQMSFHHIIVRAMPRQSCLGLAVVSHISRAGAHLITKKASLLNETTHLYLAHILLQRHVACIQTWNSCSSVLRFFNMTSCNCDHTQQKVQGFDYFL